MTRPSQELPSHRARGHLDDNVMFFARVLRAAGLPVGPDRVVDVLDAVLLTGVERREDFYWALRTVLIDRHEQIPTFDQAFQLFWRDPRLLDRAMRLLLPQTQAEPQPWRPPAAAQRVMDALLSGKRHTPSPPREERQNVTARLRYSEAEVLQHKDFEAMSGEELVLARRALQQMRLSLKPVPTRRQRVSPLGTRVDMRATLRAGLRGSADIVPLRRSRRATRPPALVVLCDISGSMATYSRMLLHFVHGLQAGQERMSTFLFGTRLSNITRYLDDRDVDAALERIGRTVQDWAGGTRIGHCLHEFNRRWSRRVLARGAVVVLISDGLDRDAGDGLAKEMERLHKSCRRLIWLNPLLRYPGFEARPAGIRAMRPWVDEFLTVHNLNSIQQLSRVLSRPN